MSIEVTARNEQINDRLQHYARQQAATISQDFPKVEHVQVVLNFERHLYSAEFVVRSKGGQVIASDEHTDNVMTAIDGALDKIRRQLRKQREKQVTTRYTG